MEISVIIPVFNADKYIEKAVDSALKQPETGEVLLVEDGSSDTSHSLCKALAKRYVDVRLLQHENGENKGAGASRNLGIINAKYQFISFLDADDYYLPDRFKVDEHEFNKNPDIDGVYGSTGIHYETEEAREEWSIKRKAVKTTLTEVVPPERLFHALLYSRHGAFTTDSITVKKDLFKRTGLFDENLLLHQDTAMWIKMAAVGSLQSGSIDKNIAVRRVHAGNRITKIDPRDYSTKEKMYSSLLKWSDSEKLYSINNEIKYKVWKNTLFDYMEWHIVKEKIQTKNWLYIKYEAIKYMARRVMIHKDLINARHFARFLSELYEQ